MSKLNIEMKIPFKKGDLIKAIYHRGKGYKIEIYEGKIIDPVEDYDYFVTIQQDNGNLASCHIDHIEYIKKGEKWIKIQR